jgi:hypothetical protein
MWVRLVRERWGRAPLRTPTLIIALLLVLTLAVPASALTEEGDADVPPVDPYAGYEPQTACDPTPKPGVIAFAKLLLEAYPVSGWSGISRDCDVRGPSEHKEGRAFDWAVSASNPEQAAAAEDALAKLLTPDEDGTPHALFRRFGLMYIIWNRQIFSATSPEAGWRTYGCDPNASYDSCHVAHVHFSFSTAGAQQQTSWWKMAPEVEAEPGTDGGAAEVAPVDRIVGATRAELAIRIAKRSFPTEGSAERVYLADAGDPHAAMLASVLAGSTHGAVLLTRGGERLEAPVDAELRRLLGDRGSREIVVVGDTEAFSPALVASYRGDFRVDRIAGVDEAATARAATTAMEAAGRQRTAVIVATDALEPALPMVAVAAANDWPLLFVDGDALDDDTRAFIVDAGIRQVHLAGSIDAISQGVRRDLAAIDGVAVDRQGGDDASGTAVTVARDLFVIPSAYAVADPRDPALAAVAAAYAGERRHAPLLLTDGEALDDATLRYVEQTTSPDTTGVIIGGRALITTDVERALRRALR